MEVKSKKKYTSARFTCHDCNESFHFNSNYLRHCKTKKHRDQVMDQMHMVTVTKKRKRGRPRKVRPVVEVEDDDQGKADDEAAMHRELAALNRDIGDLKSKLKRNRGGGGDDDDVAANGRRTSRRSGGNRARGRGKKRFRRWDSPDDSEEDENERKPSKQRKGSSKQGKKANKAQGQDGWQWARGQGSSSSSSSGAKSKVKPKPKPSVKLMSFEAARTYTRTLGLVSEVSFRVWASTTALPARMPADPDVAYASKGWGGWRNFLGPSCLAGLYPHEVETGDTVSPLALGRRPALAFLTKTGKAPRPVPFEWHGFWQGARMPYAEARKVARGLELRTEKAWWQWASGGERPNNIPEDPSLAYRGIGWKGWADWLGPYYRARPKVVVSKKWNDFDPRAFYFARSTTTAAATSATGNEH